MDARATRIPGAEEATGLQELNRSWVTLLACSLGTSVGAAAFPIFLVPVIGLRLEEKFGWSRLDTSSLTSIALIGGALGALAVGRLNDKWSTKAPVIMSMCAVGAMLLLAAIAPPDIFVWRIGIFMLMLLGAGTLSTPFIKIICAHFHAMRGLALGITVGAISFISAIALPWFSHLIDRFGTERFFIGAGASYLLIVLPLMLWLLPETRPARANASAALVADDAERAPPYALWLLGLAGFLLSIVTGAAAHLAAVAADGDGVSPALIGSVFAVGVMFSRPIAGFIIDQINAAHIGAFAAAMASIGLVIAALFGDRYLIVSALLLAVAVGAEFDIVAFLASKYTPASHFGAIFGWMYSAMLVAAAAGPVLIAVLRDTFGAYTIPFLSAALVAALAAGIMLLLPPYARHRRTQ